MPEPTNHEVNVRLAEFMKVEPCEHGGDIRDDEFYCGPQSYGDLDGGHLCFHCDGGVPAYTESLDLVRGVELEIKQSLSQTTDAKHIKMTRAYFDKLFKGYGRFNLLFADAPHRARACLKVIEENQNARTD